jgi:hypothetical protein
VVATPGEPNSRSRIGALLALDLRSLALLRIGIGALLLLEFGQLWAQAGAFLGEQGILPRSLLLRTVWNPLWFSLATVVSKPWELHVFFALLCAVAVALTLGWHTRWSTFFAWVALISLHSRNPLIFDRGDDLLRLTLFWALLLPWGAALSVDRRQGRDDQNLLTGPLSAGTCSVRTTACLALLLHTALVLGTLAFAAMPLPAPRGSDHGLPWQALFAALPPLWACWQVWLVPLLALTRGRLRTLVVALLAGSNLILLLWSGGSPLLALAACLPLAFLDGRCWEGPLAAIDRLAGPRRETSLGPEAAPARTLPAFLLQSVALLYLVAWTAWAAARPEQAPAFPMAGPGTTFRLEPAHSAWPTVPRARAGELTLSARRRDGTRFQAGPRREPSLDVRDRHWRNYLACLAQSQDPGLRWGFGYYLCRAWSPPRPSLHGVSELTVGYRASDGSEVVLLEHDCHPDRRLVPVATQPTAAPIPGR